MGVEAVSLTRLIIILTVSVILSFEDSQVTQHVVIIIWRTVYSNLQVRDHKFNGLFFGIVFSNSFHLSKF